MDLHVSYCTSLMPLPTWPCDFVPLAAGKILRRFSLVDADFA